MAPSRLQIITRLVGMDLPCGQAFVVWFLWNFMTLERWNSILLEICSLVEIVSTSVLRAESHLFLCTTIASAIFSQL